MTKYWGVLVEASDRLLRRGRGLIHVVRGDAEAALCGALPTKAGWQEVPEGEHGDRCYRCARLAR